MIDIFQPVQPTPWPHIIVRNCLTPQDISVCNQLVKKIDADNLPDEDKQGDIITQNLNFDHLTGTSLQILFDHEFHKKILDHWKVSYQQGFYHNVVLDYCGPKGSNGWHSDMGNSYNTCDVITLQWYIEQPHKDRTLLLKSSNGYVNSHCMTNDFVMFKSSPNTQHMFHSGNGHRTSIRLRIKTKLIGPEIIHCADQNDPLGVIIDCKNMESPSECEYLEHNLGNFTKYNLEHHNWKNLCLIDSHEDFDLAVHNLYAHDCKKIVVLFAGAIVSDKTKQMCQDLEGWYAHKNNDRVYRKYMIFPCDNNICINQKNPYGGNVLDRVINKHNHELGIYYVHPENDSKDFLMNVQRFMMPQLPNQQQDFTEISNFIQTFW